MPYLCHLDLDGFVSKPVLVPQKKPLRSYSNLQTCHFPSLIIKPVPVTPQKMVAILEDNRHVRNAKPSEKLGETSARETLPSDNRTDDGQLSDGNNYMH